MNIAINEVAVTRVLRAGRMRDAYMEIHFKSC